MGPRSNKTVLSAFCMPLGVDRSIWGSYIPVHRRAANGVGGLLLHLLTVVERGSGLTGRCSIGWVMFVL